MNAKNEAIIKNLDNSSSLKIRSGRSLKQDWPKSISEYVKVFRNFRNCIFQILLILVVLLEKISWANVSRSPKFLKHLSIYNDQINSKQKQNQKSKLWLKRNKLKSGIGSIMILHCGHFFAGRFFQETSNIVCFFLLPLSI